MLEQEVRKSSATKSKKELNVLETQIAVISESGDKTRQENNALSVCQSFRVLDEDNYLIYKKVKDTPNLEAYRFNGVEACKYSTEECQNFIQVPGRNLLRQFGIKHVNTSEISIPKELQSGTKLLGNVKYKGSITKAYLENEYNIGNLPLVLIGSQGGGKTTFMGNYANSSSRANESVVVIDFIKNCGLSDTIKSCVPKDKVVEIDLGTEDGIQGLGYNEITITNDMSVFERLKLASLQSQQIMSLIDSISIGDPLSSRMRRFLNASATVVFAQGFTSVKNVIECLENYKCRKAYIDSLDDELKEMLKEEIDTLMELDEWSKATKDNPSEVIGTKESKIEHILDRVSMLREDFKLKFMYNKPCNNNINLVECMEQGKVILIKMKECDFPTKMIKNILVTYWTSKVWLSVQLRGSIHEKPLRTNILIDEVFQAPTTMKTLEYILPQSRKFGCKFVFSTQYIRQLDSIFDTLDASGASYMLLTGATENDFKYFESRFVDFEYEDLRDMEQYSSLNLIYYSGGYSSFITKLPAPIK